MNSLVQATRLALLVRGAMGVRIVAALSACFTAVAFTTAVAWAVPPSGVILLQTANGTYVTAVNGGGGPTEPNCGPSMVALHEDATSIGPWERFLVVYIPGNPNAPVGQQYAHWAFQTSGGQYLTAVSGGGIGGTNGAVPSSQLHTDATAPGPWEKFTAIDLGGNYIALKTPDGIHYLTAVNGGGCGGANTVPFHTDATQIGPWEQFLIVKEYGP